MKSIGILAFETWVYSLSQSGDVQKKGLWAGKVMSRSNETRTEGRSVLRHGSRVLSVNEMEREG